MMLNKGKSFAALLVSAAAFCTVVTVFPAATPAQTLYAITENSSYFGWLDQYSLNTQKYNNVGSMACVPTASVNAMTYLQNRSPGYFGTALTGTSYASWTAADVKLISPGYMDTSPANGTYYNHIPYALNKYISQDLGFSVRISGIMPQEYWRDAPYDNPGYISSGLPTSAFLLNSLSATQALLFSIMYDNGGGHQLLATGINWLDANDDGIIQETENATLSFVDPLDPSATYPEGQPGGPVKLTTANIWNQYDQLTGMALYLDYSQYGGALPYNVGNYAQTGPVMINTVFAVDTVPEPQTIVLFATGFSGLVLLRRKMQS